MEDGYKGGLERRLEAAETSRTCIETALEGVKNGSMQIIAPYASIFKHPEKPFYAFGDVVKNVFQIPVDFYNYFRGSCNASFDKKLSRSLALAETIVLVYGAQKGAGLMSHFVDNRYVQASVGGFIGSEITTAAAFFLACAVFTSLASLKSKDGRKATQKIFSSIKESGKVCLITIPAGILSFASADLGIAALAVKLGVDSAASATLGAVGGFVLYSGAAKVAVQSSAENGYLKHN